MSHDVLVGILVVLGVWLFLSALLNWEWYLAIYDFAFLETVFGDQAARWACGLAGLALAVFGVVKLAGVEPDGARYNGRGDAGMSVKQSYVEAVSRLPDGATLGDVIRAMFEAAVARGDRDAAEGLARGLIDPHRAEDLFTRLPIDEAAKTVRSELGRSIPTGSN